MNVSKRGNEVENEVGEEIVCEKRVRKQSDRKRLSGSKEE